MPDVRLTFTGNLDVELSPTANRGGWSLASLVRFREGCPERILGWVKAAATNLAGVCRQLHFWSDLSSVLRFAAGTHTNLYLIDQVTKAVSDITPVGLAPGLQSSSPLQAYSLRIWSLDNFGQVLLGVPSGGGLYAWTPPNTASPAVIVPSAPPHNQGMFVAMPSRIVMMFGSCQDGDTAIDPMLMRWSDADDYTVWTPATDNFAGQFRLSRGNRIIGALQGPTAIYIWTDKDVWTAQWIGAPLVWNFSLLSQNAGLVSQNAAAVMGTTVYWAADHGFFRSTGGGVEMIPCTVWDKVYLDLDQDNVDKITVCPNYHYGEIAWNFPSASRRTGENDTQVKYNINENRWDYSPPGSVIADHTAWTDWNRPGGPVGAHPDGSVHQHDVGFTADGEPIPGIIIRSAFNDIDDGTSMQFIERYMPDGIFMGPDPKFNLTFMVRDYPNAPIRTSGPHLITPSTPFVMINLRGREWAEEIDMSNTNGFYRRGVPRARISRDGRL